MDNSFSVHETKSIQEVLELLIEFNNEVYPSLSSRVGSLEEYSSKLFTFGQVVFFRNNEDIFGFVAYYLNDQLNKIAFLSQIILKSKYQGKGLGNYLLKYVINDTRKNGMRALRLEVYYKNLNAIKLYEKFNFTLHEKCNDFYTFERKL